MIGYETVGLLYFGFSMEQTVDLLYSGLKHLVYSILGSFYLGTDTNAEYKWIVALLIYTQLRQAFWIVSSVKTFSRNREFNEGGRRINCKRHLKKLKYQA